MESGAAPLLALPQGGVAERSSNVAKPPLIAAKRKRVSALPQEMPGWFSDESKGKPPRLRLLRWLREILFMTQPPLLAVMQGGEQRLIGIFSQVHEPCLQSGSANLDSSGL